MIIGLSGRIGSGKDTVADYLEKQHGFNRYSYANAVKDCLSLLFGWDRELLNGYTKESRTFREQPDVWWSKRLGIENFSPRFAMQYIATDVFRKHFHDQIWVASLEKKLQSETKNCVVTDCRFVNEFYSIKSLNGLTIRIERGENPDWYQYAKDLTNSYNLEKLREFNVHASEYESVYLPYDHIINNDETLEDLYKKIESVINN
jgi:hypothetical protein